MPITHSREVLTGSRLKAQGPLDAKAVVPTIVDRDAIPTIERYHLMRVDVQDTGAQYQLKNAGDLSVWTEQTTSGITEAPLDGEAYVRQSGSWAISPESGWLVSGTTTLDNTNDVLINKPAVTGLDINSIIIRGAGDRTPTGGSYFISELILSSDGDNDGGNFVKLGSYESINGDSESYIEMDSGNDMHLYTRGDTDYTSVRVSETVFSITGGWGGNFSSSRFSKTGIVLHSPSGTTNSIQIRDDSLRGMWYFADYSVEGINIFGDRWIPDKGYVDSVAGGGGSPGGADTQIQFNNNGVFGGSDKLVFDTGISQLTLGDGTGAFGLNSIWTNSSIAATENIQGRFALHVNNSSGQLWLQNLASRNIQLSADPTVDNFINNGQPLGIGTSTPNAETVVDLVGVTSLTIPKGTTAERPTTPVSSMIRFNTDNVEFEGHDGTAWGALGGGGGTPGGTVVGAIQFRNATGDGFDAYDSVLATSTGFSITGIGTTYIDKDRFHILQADNFISDVFLGRSNDGVGGALNIRLTMGNEATPAISLMSDAPESVWGHHNFINTGTVLGIGTSSPNPALVLDIVGTSAITIPKGTSAQRPATPVSSMLRFNTDDSQFEGYDGTVWGPLGGGTGGGGGTEVTAMFDSDLDIVRDTYMFGAAEFTSINYDIAALNSVTIETSTDFINWTIQATLTALNIFTQAQTGSSYYIRLTANYIAGVTHTTGAQLTYIR